MSGISDKVAMVATWAVVFDVQDLSRVTTSAEMSTISD